jgi:hypothetical protein
MSDHEADLIARARLFTHSLGGVVSFHYAKWFAAMLGVTVDEADLAIRQVVADYAAPLDVAVDTDARIALAVGRIMQAVRKQSPLDEEDTTMPETTGPP